MRTIIWARQLRFEADKSFFELKAVKATFAIAILAAAIITLVIIFNSRIEWRLDYHGMNHFLTVFKLPLGILATLIPIIALLAANHRSVQTKEQIRVTVSNNNFVNYFRHVEQFEKYVDERSGLKNYVTNKDLVHTFLFPNALAGDLAVSHNVENILQGFIDIVDSKIRKLSKIEYKDALLILQELRSITSGFCEERGIKVYSAGSRHSVSIPGTGGKTLSLVDGDFASIFREIGSTLLAIETFAKFDRTYSFGAELSLAVERLSSAPKLYMKDLDKNQEFHYALNLLS